MIPPLVALMVAPARVTPAAGNAIHGDWRLEYSTPDGWRELSSPVTSDALGPFSKLKELPLLRECSLVAVPCRGRIELLEQITLEQLIPKLASPADGLSVKAAIHLIHDFWDACHELAQRAEELGGTQTGPYWHGIAHRREPDYDNARYWFRRVGSHSIFPEIGRDVAELVHDSDFRSQLRFDSVIDRRGQWDPMAFIELCEQCGATWDARAQAAARLQEIEMRRLLEYTCRAAVGER